MSKWLEAETAVFNRTFARRKGTTPLVEFLTVAARRAAAIYGRALHDVTAQVSFPRFLQDTTGDNYAYPTPQLQNGILSDCRGD